MTSTAIDLSVVIVSFNARDHLERTLTAVEADLVCLTSEVIVVDNSSDDGSAMLVRRRHPTVRLIENGSNRGYTAANNQGFAVAGGRYVLILNPDATPAPGTLPALVSALDVRPEVGLASCRLVWPDGRTQANGARDWTLGALLAEHSLPGLVLGRTWSRRHRTYAGWARDSERDVDVLPGSVLCVRRDVLARVGGFDERLHLYFGEDEWCARVRAAGYAVRYLPLGAVVHTEGVSARRVPALARASYFDDMWRFAALRFGPGRARCLRTLLWPTRLALSLAARRPRR